MHSDKPNRKPAAGRGSSFDTFALAAGNATSSFAAIGINAALSRLLVPEEYADYRKVLLIFAITAPIYTLGLSQAILFESSRRPDGARSPVAAAVTLFLCALTVMVGLVVVFQTAIDGLINSSKAANLARIYALSVAASGVSALLSSFFMSKGRSARAAFAIASGPLISVVVLFVTRPGDPASAIRVVVIGQLLGLVLVLLLALPVVRSQNGRRRSVTADQWSLLTFGAPLALGTSIAVVSRQLDKVVVSGLSDPAAFATYTNGAFEIPLLGVATSAVAVVMMRDFTRLVVTGDIEPALRLQEQAMRLLIALLMPISVFLFVLAPDVLEILLGPVYRDSASVFRIYLLVIPARTLSWSSLLMAKGQTGRLAAIGGVTLILNLAFTYIGVKLFDTWAAAAATVLTTYCVAVLGRVLVTARVFGIPIKKLAPWPAALKGIALYGLLATPLFVASHLLESAALWSRVLGVAAVHGIFTLAAWQMAGDRRRIVTTLRRVVSR